MQACAKVKLEPLSAGDGNEDGAVLPEGFAAVALLREEEGKEGVQDESAGQGGGRVRGAGLRVSVGKREMALFALRKDKVYCTDAVCPHQGGNLELGDIEDSAGAHPRVLCPRHGWAFEVDSGWCEDACDYALHAYEARVLPGGLVCVADKPLPQPSRE